MIALGGDAIEGPWDGENRQSGILTAKALMKEGGVIDCEAPRHPFPAMHPAVRAGLQETARRLNPQILR